VPTQQMLAAQQLAAPLQQLNDAQRAEAHTLLDQVGCSSPDVYCCCAGVWGLCVVANTPAGHLSRWAHV
jgi:hypothetical protein